MITLKELTLRHLKNSLQLCSDRKIDSEGFRTIFNLTYTSLVFRPRCLLNEANC